MQTREARVLSHSQSSAVNSEARHAPGGTGSLLKTVPTGQVMLAGQSRQNCCAFANSSPGEMSAELLAESSRYRPSVHVVHVVLPSML